jgi:hypothetical protein
LHCVRIIVPECEAEIFFFVCWAFWTAADAFGVGAVNVAVVVIIVRVAAALCEAATCYVNAAVDGETVGACVVVVFTEFAIGAEIFAHIPSVRICAEAVTATNISNETVMMTHIACNPTNIVFNTFTAQHNSFISAGSDRLYETFLADYDPAHTILSYRPGDGLGVVEQ